MSFKFSLLSAIILVLFPVVSKSQEIVFEDANHVIYYELKNDSIKITIEDLNDFTLDHNYSLDSSLFDYVILQIDQNQSGAINDSQNIDTYFAFNPLESNNICSGYIFTGSTLTACGSKTTGAVSSVSLEATVFNSTSHLVYEFSIPQSELFTGSHVCTRLSAIVHRAGTATSAAYNLPGTGTSTYFVNPYVPIKLFNEVNLGPDSDFCPSDTIFANANYPYYLWSTGTTETYITPTASGNYALTVADNTCSLSDTVNINLQTQQYCNSVAISFPSIITPNDDGYNDIFEPFPSVQLDNIVLSETHLKIYNRWGVQVGGRKGFPSWDGYLDWGKKAPQGTYFFVLEITGATPYVTNGYFTLID